MRVIFHVRCHGEPDENTEQEIMTRLSDAVDIPEKLWGILTIGREYYHDNGVCQGHPDPRDLCQQSPDVFIYQERRPDKAIPHCRTHLEFRSDCKQCISEAEFFNG